MPLTNAASTPGRILYFRVVEPDYPRNRRVREYLTGRGHEVVVVPPATGRARLLNHLVDLARLARATRRGDTIFVAEQYVRATPLAAIVAAVRRCRLVVDGFVGVHETAVEDWGVARPGSVRARRFALQDRFALRAADCVLIDTDVRAAALRARSTRPLSVITLPVGAPDWARPVTRQPAPDGVLRVLYYGNYIPLHGLDVVLHALARTTTPVRLTMLGDGSRRQRFERLVAELGLGDRVEFRPPVRERDLRTAIEEHDVVLGVFGDSPKARSVIANKVWQGLACGRTVLTRESPALAEVPAVALPLLHQVEPGPDALAAALERVAASGTVDAVPDIADRLEDAVRARFDRLGAWLDGARP
jgi:glycosyltransferase involved in cell wall biosynthesis